MQSQVIEVEAKNVTGLREEEIEILWDHLSAKLMITVQRANERQNWTSLQSRTA